MSERTLVMHLGTKETYEAILLDDRPDGSIIFQIVGDNADAARVLCESDNLEVDTLFEPSWKVLI